MMRKQQWTVRVILTSPVEITSRTSEARLAEATLWLGEVLRYMGHSRQIGSFDDPQREVYEIYSPIGDSRGSKVWAEMNAARMRSFGINAAAAPKWDGEKLEVR